MCIFVLFLFSAVLPSAQEAAPDTAAGADGETTETAKAAPAEETLGEDTGTEGASAEDPFNDTAQPFPEGAGGEDASEENSAGEEVRVLTAEESRIEMEIRTSTLQELASWARGLGLSEGGAHSELAARLRNHFNLPQKQESADGDQKIITIESARSAEYFTLDVVNEDYARLKGSVIITLKDKDISHSIKAREVLYNKTRNIITASGGVEYIKQEGDTIETFRGQTITVDMNDWSSIFVGGVSERSISGSETAYRFSGKVISRTDEEVTILTDAEVTNAANEESYWSIHASKLWLLPGYDWAVAHAVLKVGEIPVLYIPYFYYPADEIVFHPVLGYRSREGSYVQTTTYFLGRMKSDPEKASSITRILGSGADMEKKREGIFLRSTGKKDTSPNDTRFSLLFDAYANLGAYLGTELALPKKTDSNFGAIDLSFGLGITRDVMQSPEGFYTPYPEYDGVSNWNSSRLFSLTVPFRYRLNTKGSYSGKYASFSWLFPFYSDPYVDQDFMNRAEEQNFFDMLKPDTTVEETTTTDTGLSSYQWQLSGSVTPNEAIKFLNPYISSFSISSIASTVSFKTRSLSTASPGYLNYSPSRVFFYPDKFTLYSINMSVSGTPLTWGNTAAASSAGSGANSGANSGASAGLPDDTDDPFKDMGLPRPPWAGIEDQGGARTPNTGYTLSPPVLNQTFAMARLGAPRFSIDYRLNPSMASELQFRSSQDNWREVEDINWSEISSILSTMKGDGSIGFNLKQSEGDIYSSSFKISAAAAWQNYSYINEDAEEFIDTVPNPTETKIDEAKKRAYSQTSFTSSWEFNTTIKPLKLIPMWSNSSLQYDVKGLLAKSVFEGTGADPLWHVDYGKWDRDNLDTHRVTAVFSADIADKVQSLSLSTDLPPEESAITGNAAVRFWISETLINGKIITPFETAKYDPVNFTETLKFAENYQLKEYVVYDPEKKELTNFTSTLNLGRSLSASLNAAWSYSYHLETTGWVADTEERLNWREFSANYTKEFKWDNLWNKRIPSLSFNIRSGLKFDLQRYTNSNFNLNLGFSINIKNFLSLNFSTTSENSVIFRYFKDIPFFNLPIDLPEGDQNNIFLDLINSFRFDDEALRRSSGFKLKSFNLSAIHFLGDWTAEFKITLSPYLQQNTGQAPIYKFNNEISFMVKWTPISEIKTEINYSKETITLK
ncbi:MAG: LPS-assembly protein LptD [Treponema sp.]|jgi:hypothetical protein|nr:LPS-assembly protein LptD [Treponema sp.]